MTLAKAAGSRIPQMSLKCGKSQFPHPRQLDNMCVPGTNKKTAVSPTTSRLPVRVKELPTVHRSTSSQIRHKKRPDSYAARPMDSGFATSDVFCRLYIGTAEATRSCFKPEPIKNHRNGVKPKSILKHRVRSSGELKLPPPPSAFAGHGVTSNPAKKKTVCWAEALESCTPARHWPKGLVTQWQCVGCGSLPCHCPHLEEPPTGVQAGEDWVQEQKHLGNTYVELASNEFGYRPIILETTP